MILALIDPTRVSIVGSCGWGVSELVSFRTHLLRLSGGGINIVNLIKRTNPESRTRVIGGEHAFSNGKVHFLPSFQYHNIPMSTFECGTVLEGIEIMVFEVCLGDL